MSTSPWATARRRCIASIAAVGLAASMLAGAAPAAAAPSDPPLADPQPAADGAAPEFVDGTYIVSFRGDPAATYRGGLRGLAATAPRHGAQIDPDSTQVRRYEQHLEATQEQVLHAVGADAFYNYTLALNGVAVELTAEQAQALAKSPEVRSVAPDELRQLTTDSSPEFLGLPRGLWPAAGGQDSAGAGVVVGVLDSGIWPESPSFAPNRTPVPDDWAGTCEAGEQFSVSACNGKIIGARSYVDGFGKKNVAKEDYLSPRDGNGHGTHTASTAAGNRVEDVAVDGVRFGEVSGMAPGAKIAAYKVCWTGVTGTGCHLTDAVAAVEDAIRDGVDVINYSIGSNTESPVIDLVQLAFLNAAAAGVFVAASAGNAGPGASTLDHPSPWVTTVAASAHKINEKVLELADGRRFLGASTTRPLPALTPLVLAADAAAKGVDRKRAALCALGSLDPKAVDGALVVCDRGVVDRVEKSRAVLEAGGAGMVLINPTPNSVNGDLHYVPSIHLDADAHAPVTSYVAGSPAPRGRIVEVRRGESDTRVPEVVSFSSRGPSTTTGGDILKPDLSAPGVDVLAAVAPPFRFGRQYDLLSGTSMSAPHVAGLAAVLVQLHPDWSPMAVKSALMTTARDHVSTGDPFAQGAGLVRPNRAMDPGLVFDHGVLQWLGYLEGVVGENLFPLISTVDGSQLNQASVALGALAGVETVSRTVRNVSGRSERYRIEADVPGIRVDVSQQQFTLAAGQSKTVELTFTRRSTAAYDTYTTGDISFVGERHLVRLPVAIRPVRAAVEPREVRGSGPTGSAGVTVTSGFTGTLTTSVKGLVGATPRRDSVTANRTSFNPLAPSDPDDSVDTRTYTVPKGATLVRASVDGAADADLDLFVYRIVEGKPQLVDFSATGSADEEVTLIDPPPGQYVVYVHGFAVASTGEYLYSSWRVGDRPAGNLTATPAAQPVSPGQQATVTARWTGLDPSRRYLGWIGVYDGRTLAGRAIVSVN